MSIWLLLIFSLDLVGVGGPSGLSGNSCGWAEFPGKPKSPTTNKYCYNCSGLGHFFEVCMQGLPQLTNSASTVSGKERYHDCFATATTLTVGKPVPALASFRPQGYSVIVR